MPNPSANVLYKGNPGRGTRIFCPGLANTEMHKSRAQEQPEHRIMSLLYKNRIHQNDKLYLNKHSKVIYTGVCTLVLNAKRVQDEFNELDQTGLR